VETGTVASGTAAQNVDARLAAGRALVWEDRGPVSYAGSSTPAGGVVRIGPVYTPPAHRGRGYASALVAAISQLSLDRGAAACCLYTDLANPTSNRIYLAVGYRPLCDVTLRLFGR
jgi:predicted GNAT family acetyltransferase